MVVVVVAFSLRARILGECLTIHSPPALKKKKSVFILMLSEDSLLVRAPDS